MTESALQTAIEAARQISSATYQGLVQPPAYALAAAVVELAARLTHQSEGMSMCDDCEALRLQLHQANNILAHASTYLEDAAFGTARETLRRELRGYFCLPTEEEDTDTQGVRLYGSACWAAKRGSSPLPNASCVRCRAHQYHRQDTCHFPAPTLCQRPLQRTRSGRYCHDPYRTGQHTGTAALPGA